jgi:hypothetical protein
VQLGHSHCIIFALPLHACLALYVELVYERKLVRVWCMERLLCSQLVLSGTNKQFLGLVLTAIALQAPYIHCNRIWLDWARIRFRFIGPASRYTGSFCVFGPVLSSPAHGLPSLAMDYIEIEIF